MSASIARLAATACGGRTRATRVFASSPQRWSLATRESADGWLEATHQLLGDGHFSGERSRTSVAASGGARLVVRGVTGTPLRAGPRSLAAVRLRVGQGARLLYFPGVLIPHGQSEHAGSLRITVEGGGQVLAASTVVPGRSAAGECALFRRLTLRTRVTLGRELAMAESAAVEGEFASNPGVFGDAGAYVSIVAIGTGLSAETDWWAAHAAPGAVVAANDLRAGGFVVRGLFPNLGGANEFLAEAERAARSAE